MISTFFKFRNDPLLESYAFCNRLIQFVLFYNLPVALTSGRFTSSGFNLSESCVNRYPFSSRAFTSQKPRFWGFHLSDPSCLGLSPFSYFVSRAFPFQIFVSRA